MQIKQHYQTIAISVLIMGAIYLGYMEIKRLHTKIGHLEAMVRGVRVYQQTHANKRLEQQVNPTDLLNELNNTQCNVQSSSQHNNVHKTHNTITQMQENSVPNILTNTETGTTKNINLNTKYVNNDLSSRLEEDSTYVNSNIEASQQNVQNESTEKRSLDTLMEEYNRNLEQVPNSDETSSYYTEDDSDYEYYTDDGDVGVDGNEGNDVSNVVSSDNNVESEGYAPVELDENLKRDIENLSQGILPEKQEDYVEEPDYSMENNASSATNVQEPQQPEIHQTQPTVQLTDKTNTSHNNQTVSVNSSVTAVTATGTSTPTVPITPSPHPLLAEKNKNKSPSSSKTTEQVVNSKLKVHRQLFFENVQTDDLVFKERFKQYTCKDLKEILKSFDIATTGSKNVLLDKLVKYKKNISQTSQTVQSNTVNQQSNSPSVSASVSQSIPQSVSPSVSQNTQQNNISVSLEQELEM